MASPRPLAHLETGLLFPASQGTKCWSLSLRLHCPESHRVQDTYSPDACPSHLHREAMTCPGDTEGREEWQMSDFSNSETLARKEIC